MIKGIPNKTYYNLVVLAADKASEFTQRIKQYKLLRKYHFSQFEADKFVTSTYKDSSGKVTLQPLDLTNNVWHDYIVERQEWYNQQIINGEKLGMDKKQSIYRAFIELKNYYTRNDKDVFGWFKEHYKKGMRKSDVNFEQSMSNRRGKKNGYEHRKG
jgi:hypothetical protein